MKTMLAMLVLLSTSVAVASTTYEERPGPLQQLDMPDVLTADALSDGSTSAWIPVRGWAFLTLEIKLVDASASVSALSMTCQQCNYQGASTGCSASTTYNLKSLGISAGTGTVSAYSWVYNTAGGLNGSENWSLTLATNYRWVRCSWTATGAQPTVDTLAVGARVMATK
jgi:hypothetical protein